MAEGLGLGLLCWSFKGVQETLQIGLVAFPRGQCPSPQLSACPWLFNEMDIKTVPHPPFSPYLAPSDFWLFPKLRGCRYETIEEMKEAVMKVIDTFTQEDFHWALPEVGCNGTTSALLPEDITSKGTRVSCVYYPKKCPYEKSLETYLMILVYIYIYIYIYI